MYIYGDRESSIHLTLFFLCLHFLTFYSDQPQAQLSTQAAELGQLRDALAAAEGEARVRKHRHGGGNADEASGWPHAIDP